MGAVSDDFADQVVLLVGASRSIGAGTARAFARAGASVVLASRNQEALDAVGASIEADGGTALAVAVDATDAGQVEQLVATTLEHFGRQDVAFNNASDGAGFVTGAVVGVDGGQYAGVRPPLLDRRGGSTGPPTDREDAGGAAT